MAAGSTYSTIATTTLGSAAASYTFSSIPSTYTDLILVADYQASATADSYIQFNGDTGSTYSYTVLAGNGTSAVSGRSSGTGIVLTWYSDAANQQANILININNYSNATTYKTSISRHNNAAVQTGTNVGLWRSTAAINSIKIYRGSGNFNTGSTFTLYGIAAA